MVDLNPPFFIVKKDDSEDFTYPKHASFYNHCMLTHAASDRTIVGHVNEQDLKDWFNFDLGGILIMIDIHKSLMEEYPEDLGFKILYKYFLGLEPEFSFSEKPLS